MSEIWRSEIASDESRNLSVIIPLVVYHDRSRWKLDTRLSRRIEGYDDLPDSLKRHVPDFEYIIYDVANNPNECEQGEVDIWLALEWMRAARSHDRRLIVKTFELSAAILSGMQDEELAISEFKLFTNYAFGVIGDFTITEVNEIQSILEKLFPEGGETMITIAELLKNEGRVEGRAEGRAEGRVEGRAEAELESSRSTILRLLRRRFNVVPDPIVSKIMTLDKDELRILIDNVFEYQTVFDVEKYMD